MKRSLFLIVCLYMTTSILQAQTYERIFQQNFQKEDIDTLSFKKLFTEWETNSPNDPALYISLFNYYYRLGQSSVIELGNEPKGDHALMLQNTDSTQTDPTGSIYEKKLLNNYYLKMSFESIDKGITKYPNRLDMRLGRIYALSSLNNYKDMTDNILSTLDYSGEINNHWYWSNNIQLEKPEETLLNAVQDYFEILFNKQDSLAIEYMKLISQKVLEYYPENAVYLSNLATVYHLQHNVDKALEIYLKALVSAPEDCIVLSNIASIYFDKEDYPNAIKYYKLIVKHGNEDFKKMAKEKLNELKKIT